MTKTNAGKQQPSQEREAAEFIDTPIYIRRMKSIARMALSAVAGRHQCGGQLEVDIGALQATMTLLLSLWEQVSEAKDSRSGRFSADLINEGRGMEWFQARGLIVLLDHLGVRRT